MREQTILNSFIKFVDILEFSCHKCVGEHSSIHIVGHVGEDREKDILKQPLGQQISFTAHNAAGEEMLLFQGITQDIQINTINNMRILTMNCVSNSTLMDIQPKTRTYQDRRMTYGQVTARMALTHPNFSFLLPDHENTKIGAMLVQYEETDWEFAKRIASRLGTIVVADYMLSTPYISIGIPHRKAIHEFDAVSYTMRKDADLYMRLSRNGVADYREYDAISYIVKSREIYNLCDPVLFMGNTLYIYSIDTSYNGGELVHQYSLKGKNGIRTYEYHNKNLIGASLIGRVLSSEKDTVQIKIDGDVKQTTHKWFPFATPFSSPDGPAWYFMPEPNDEVRLCFPNEKEDDAYVASAVHISHGLRNNPQIKFIRTIYNQVITFAPKMLKIDNGAGSSITMDISNGITIETSKNIKMIADENINMDAFGKISISGKKGVTLSQNDSVINVDDTIDIVSMHTRIE